MPSSNVNNAKRLIQLVEVAGISAAAYAQPKPSWAEENRGLALAVVSMAPVTAKSLLSHFP